MILSVIFQEKNPTAVAGRAVSGDLLDQMNWHVTIASTQELNHSAVNFVKDHSHAQTTSHFTWKDMLHQIYDDWAVRQFISNSILYRYDCRLKGMENPEVVCNLQF